MKNINNPNLWVLPGEYVFFPLNKKTPAKIETGAVGPNYVIICQGENKKKERFVSVANVDFQTTAKLQAIWDKFTEKGVPLNELHIDIWGGWKGNASSNRLGNFLCKEILTKVYDMNFNGKSVRSIEKTKNGVTQLSFPLNNKKIDVLIASSNLEEIKKSYYLNMIIKLQEIVVPIFSEKLNEKLEEEKNGRAIWRESFGVFLPLENILEK